MAGEPLEVAVCMGSSCFSRGNNRTIENLQKYLRENGLEEQVLLKGHLCEGLCKNGPNVTVASKVCHAVDPERAAELLHEQMRLD